MRRTLVILAILWAISACAPPQGLQDEYTEALDRCKAAETQESFDRCVRRVDEDFDPRFRECIVGGCDDS